jgi:hypothetical protein
VLELHDAGEEVRFSFEDLMRYAGPASPGGVAHAYKAIERALPLLSPERPPERREIHVATPFGGPGARDAFELVLHAVTEGRYEHRPALARHELGPLRERFVFRFAYRDRRIVLGVRPGFVTEEFIALARTEEPTWEQTARLTLLKRVMAEHVMSAAAPDVYAEL